MTRVVTLSSVGIRIAISTQVNFAMSMIAAIVVERVGTHPAAFSQLSIARSNSLSPTTIFWAMATNSKKGLFRFYLLFVSLYLALAVASQFTSTILLLDFKPNKIAGEVQRRDIAFGLRIANNSQSPSSQGGNNFWQTTPSTYPRFAELAERPVLAEGISDTGSTLRAYVPFGSEIDRGNLRNYSGVATVQETRVVCVRPNIRLTSVKVNDLETGLVTGSLDFVFTWQNDYPILAPAISDTNLGSCTIGLSEKGTDGVWQTSLCGVSSTLLRGLRRNNRVYGTSEPWSDQYMLLNTTGIVSQWVKYRGTQNGSNWSQSSAQEWTRLTSKDGSASVIATLCFFDKFAQDFRLNIWSNNDSAEPTLSRNNESRAYELEDVRKMLQATNRTLSIDDRHVYHLEPVSDWPSVAASNLYNVRTRYMATSRFDYGLPRSGVLFRGSIEGTEINFAHINVFQQTFQETLNPALAVQALFTVLTLMSYYEYRPGFDASAPAEFVISTSALIPGQWTGFAIVIAIIFLHLIAIVFTTVLFLQQTNTSKLGNAWQAVAQVYSDDTKSVILQSTDMTDGEVKSLWDKQGLGSATMQLEEPSHMGRTQAVFRKNTKAYEMLHHNEHDGSESQFQDNASQSSRNIT